MTANLLTGNPSDEKGVPNLPVCPELLAPAGDWDCAKAAVENGADAIYFGLDRFNARIRAHNFTESDLPKLMSFLHRRGVKGYVTFNTLVFPAELPEAELYIRAILATGVDAAIVQDVGICRLIRHLSPDFPIHASTQMTVTSAAGVGFVRDLGCQLVVLARECSLAEINKIQAQLGSDPFPLEAFVHGALCVAYSGQCLTSESLGGRSANRGECAQACRMPYDLIADGQEVDLGDRKYLLSPQDLAGLELLPQLVRSGLACLKIEGRLKTPEYVANVTRIYRQALDRVITGSDAPATPQDRYDLEMGFSRGLSTGWLNGIDNQTLVHARFGKKRGVYLGQVTRLQAERIGIRLQAPLKPGDGVVFDNGHPESAEEGGRVYSVETRGGEAILTFGQGDLNLSRIRVGDRLWKTSDPELDRRLRQSFQAEHPRFQRPLDLEVHGSVDQPFTLIARDAGLVVQVQSEMPLVEAHTKPLTTDRLRDQLGRLGNTPFCLGELDNQIHGSVLLPVSELNRLRRQVVEQLETLRSQPQRWQVTPGCLADLMPAPSAIPPGSAHLIALVRDLDQLAAALARGIQICYCEFEDPKRYRTAVEQVRQTDPQVEIWVAPPRITKPGEQWILEQVRASEADGYLIRNYDQLNFFQGERCVGDFSLNIANPLTADYFIQRFQLERVTASYDLNIQQLKALFKSSPANWYEITLHQHMPMFHMEHCVFCAFLSEGTDYTNCGRPCESHQVKLRDRVGSEHILKADVGCRNTVFNSRAQTGAEVAHQLLDLGIRYFRIEFVDESPEQVSQTLQQYQQLLKGEISGSEVWRKLKVLNQLGVTRGQL